MELLWLIVAGSLFSAFYGIRANFVDNIEYDGQYKKTANIINSIYIFIFHFLGSAIGWLLIYCLAIRIKSIWPNMNQLEWLDIILLLFGFLGITGHLPQTLYGFVSSFGKIAESITAKISK